MRATTVLAATMLLVSSSGWAAEDLPSKAPWAGSQVIYEHSFSAISVDKGAELTSNPYYVHSLSLRPEYHPIEPFYLRGRLDVEQELTDADDTSRIHEWLWSDLWLDAVATGVTEPRSGIKVGGNVRFVVPLSKISAAQTLRLGIGPALSLSRKFPVLEGLEVRYGGRFTFNFHKYTTAQFDAPGIICNSADCGSFNDQQAHAGLRNNHYVFTQGPTVLFDPIKNLEITLSYTFIYNRLYPLTSANVSTDGGIMTVNGDGDVPDKWGQWFVADVGYTLFDFFTVSAGVNSLFPALAPDSTYRTPFVNRFTNLYVDLTVDVDGVVNKFKK